MWPIAIFQRRAASFIVADAPGHEQYTRNMATAASTADLAVLLVDARNGLLTQTLRHSHIVALMGIRHIVLAVNKMDVVSFDQPIFDQIADSYRKLAGQIGLTEVMCIPLSALRGDNVTSQGAAMPWYAGPTLLRYLEIARCLVDAAAKPFRMPVQWINRPHQDFRGYCGTVVSGLVRVGDRLVVLPSGKATSVARIVNYGRRSRKCDCRRGGHPYCTR